MHIPGAPSGWTSKDPNGDQVGNNHVKGRVIKFHPDAIPAIQASRAPQSTTSSFHINTGKGRTEHVARPRNAFILFRCDFVQEHTKDGCRPRRVAGVPGKTVSKRAGEAWHLLSKEQRDHYHDLAEQEKLEHAQRYPNYRFQPLRRSSVERSRRSAARLLSGPRISIRRTAKSRHSVSKNRSLVAQTRSPSPSASPPDSPVSQPAPAVPSLEGSSEAGDELNAITRGLHRRSFSVPVLSSHYLPSGDDAMSESVPRNEVRRTRSMGEGGSSLPNYPMQFISGPSEAQYSISSSQEFYAPNTFANGNAFNYPDRSAAFDDIPNYHTSPLSAVASSLAGWNGEPLTSRVPTPASSPDSTWSSLPGYSTQSNPDEYYQFGYPRQPVPPHDYVSWGVQPSYAPESRGVVPGAYLNHEPSVAGALHQYDIGLSERIVGRTPDGGLMPFEPRSMDGYNPATYKAF
ncbi:uncharacterized protein BT62DRAFT_47983 [Guyanagaster necrorhizus]|uniref:HMG box domain-containing protein n=1 Tax=Guyanagaster necrorhizus TaxID=856835 RepID=A0A9P7W5U0_9AGAR|nr:uncharacterized protein BT62DRAFT_47983 [Guyanagaster necrorhizus MCA 3950]KAG7453129.1 hypothetical protein BT62DRAFT_47983 [Guyanagaster necrorhizus MCA 3950]